MTIQCLKSDYESGNRYAFLRNVRKLPSILTNTFCKYVLCRKNITTLKIECVRNFYLNFVIINIVIVYD